MPSKIIALIFISLGLVSYAQVTPENNPTIASLKIVEPLKYLSIPSLNYYKDIEVECPEINGLKDILTQNKINKELKKIFVDQLYSVNYYQSMRTHAIQTLSNYANKYSNYQQDIINPSICNILQVDFEVLSYTHGVLNFRMVTVYRIASEDRQISDLFLRNSKIYYLNMQTGIKYESKDVFLKNSGHKLFALLNRNLKENLQPLTFSQLKRNLIRNEAVSIEEEYNVEDQETHYTALLNNAIFSQRMLLDESVLQEYLPYLKGFTFAFFIPSWSKCTKEIYGIPIEISCRIDEIIPFLNPNGPFGFLKTNIPKKANTKLRDVFLPTVFKNNPNHPEIRFFEEVPLHTKDCINTIEIFNETNSKEPVKMIHYLKNGNLERVSDLIKKSKTVWEFDSLNRPILQTTIYQNQTEIETRFLYDKKNNLLVKKVLENGSYKITHYKYIDNLVLEETSEFIYNSNQPNNNSCSYLFSDDGKLVSKKTTYDLEPAIYKYDTKDKLIYISNNLTYFLYTDNYLQLDLENDHSKLHENYIFDNDGNIKKNSSYYNMDLNKTSTVEYESKNNPISIFQCVKNPYDESKMKELKYSLKYSKY